MVNNGSTDVTAKIADGQNFVDPNHWIEVPTFSDLTSDYPLIKTVTSWELSADFTNLARGAYFLKVTTSMGTTNLRILISE